MLLPFRYHQADALMTNSGLLTTPAAWASQTSARAIAEAQVGFRPLRS
jgi:hypothetical protein